MNIVRYLQTELRPSKVICIGRNYREHAKELNNPIPTEPVIFIKPNSSISEQIHCLRNEVLHYETELCFLLLEGRCAGLGIGLDLTKRHVQDRLKKQGLPWERAKAFDGSAVFSPFIKCPDHLGGLRLELMINQQQRQIGGVKDMIFQPDELLANISHFMSVEDGDILMTGTPAGVGEVIFNDQYQARIYQAESLLLEQNWTVEEKAQSAY